MDHLAEIFQEQEKLLRSLAPIYEHNEFFNKNKFPLSIDGRHSQEEFRLLAWRITEEVYEALQEWDRGMDRDEDKYREEVADVMHFFAELAIICGLSSTEVATGGEAGLLLPGADYLELSFQRVQLYPLRMEPREAWGMFLTTVANLMMEFRQRPWRTDERLTDPAEMRKKFALAWFSFCTSCAITGVSARILHWHYFKKHRINEERRKSAMENVGDEHGSPIVDDL
jgi:hypothetical protein